MGDKIKPRQSRKPRNHSDQYQEYGRSNNRPPKREKRSGNKNWKQYSERDTW